MKVINRLTKKFDQMWLSDSDFIIEDSSECETDTDVIEDSSECETDTDVIEKQMYHHCVMSLDIGIKHLGISVTLLNEDYSIMQIVWIDLVDIQVFSHVDGVSREECDLGHTKTFCDWMNHVFQNNIVIFEMADIILIERQPPIGLVGIEQLIFSRWRNKAVLISPNSMHKFFQIGHFDYEQRKCKTEQITHKYLNEYSNLSDKYCSYERRHDIADSLCMTLFWISKKQEEYYSIKEKERLKTIVYNRKSNGYKLSVDDWFEQFRYRNRINTQ